MARRRWTSAALLAAVLTCVIPAGPAHAAFHLMKVSEVFPGTPADPSAQFVELQMYASGQNFVSGHSIRVSNASGVQTNVISFANDVANGANQSSILVATTQAVSLFGVPADFVMPAVLPAGGGKVCFDGFDCVAWGSYTGPSAGVGAAFHPTDGLVPGSAAKRRIDRGNATLLEAIDDTDSSSGDFVFASPLPRNNAGTTAAPGCDIVASAPSATITEGASLEIEVTGCVGSDVTISTVDGTAESPSDFVAFSETITFEETLASVTLQTNSDPGLEGDETLTVRLRNVHGAYLPTPDLELRILDVAPPIAGVPGAPAQVGIARGIRELTVSWQPPVTGDPVGAYRIYAGPQAGPRVAIATVPYTARTFTETELTNNQTRSYVVAAFNANGEGPHPPPVSATTFALPSAPLNLDASPGPLPGEVRLTWDLPTNDGGLPVTSFVIYEASELDPGMHRGGEAPGHATTITLAGRTPLVEHRYVLAAVTAVGEGPWSNEGCARPYPWPSTVGCLDA
jgi:hypothetical protein